MEILQALLLGVLEGFTEFLPISSTGHLIVAQEFMGYKDTAKIFTVVIQTGAIAAVIWNYRADLWRRTKGLFAGDPVMKRFWAVWIIATIPGGLAGFLLKDSLSVYAVATTVAIALIVGGIIIWLIETYHTAPQSKTGKPEFEKISIKQAIQVGLYQMLALVPGVSRSGSTIMGGLLSGLDRVTAASFSFYLSIPILLLASTYQLAKGYDELNTVSGGAPALIAGTVAAFVTALVVIKWLLRYVYHHDFKIFAYYRIILGIIILIALFA
jgi:undecaprenyl-diphosphatase